MKVTGRLSREDRAGEGPLTYSGALRTTGSGLVSVAKGVAGLSVLSGAYAYTATRAGVSAARTAAGKCTAATAKCKATTAKRKAVAAARQAADAGQTPGVRSRLRGKAGLTVGVLAALAVGGGLFAYLRRRNAELDVDADPIDADEWGQLVIHND